MILDDTTKKLQLKLGEAHTSTALDYVVTYTDITTTTSTPACADGTTNGTTAVDIVAAPSSNHQIMIDFLSVQNLDTVSHIVKLYYNNNGTQRTIIQVTLATKERLEYTKKEGFKITNVTGCLKKATSTVLGSSFIEPIVDAAGLATEAGPTTNRTFYFFLGIATKTSSSINILHNVTTLASTITWCELAIYTSRKLMWNNVDEDGAVGNECQLPAVILGYTNTAAIWNTTGIKNVTVNLSPSIQPGDYVYVGYGAQATVVPKFRAGLGDILEYGQSYQLSSNRPSTRTAAKEYYIPLQTASPSIIWTAAYLN